MAENNQETSQSSELPTDNFGQVDYKSLADSILAEIGVEDDNGADETTEVQAEGQSQDGDAGAEDSSDGGTEAAAAPEQEGAEGTEESGGKAEVAEKVEITRLLESEKKVRELTEKLQALESRTPPTNEALAEAVYDADDPFEALKAAGIDADLLFDRLIVARRGQDADPASVRDVEYRRTAGKQSREIQRLKDEQRLREEKATIDKQVAEYQQGLESQLAAEDKYPALSAVSKADPVWLKSMAYLTAAQFFNAGEPLTPDQLAQYLESKFSAVSKAAKPGQEKKAPPTKRSPAVEARPAAPAKKQPKKLPRDKNEAYAELEKDVVASVLKDLGL